MTKINFYILLLLFTISCNKNQENHLNKSRYSTVVNNHSIIGNKGIDSCISFSDTILENKYSVIYLPSQDFFTIKLEIKGVSKILDYKFDCFSTIYNVPEFHEFENDYLSLRLFCGDICKTFFVYHLQNNEIENYLTIENALELNLDANIYILSDSTKGYINMCNYRNKKNRRLKLTMNKTVKNIVTFEIDRNNLIITYDDNEIQTFKVLQ